MVRVLGLPDGVREAIAGVEERWDGESPHHERRTAIAPGARLLAPELVDRAMALGRRGLWAELTASGLQERMLDLEPVHRVRLSDDAGLDRIAGAFADMVDTRTPLMGWHGRRVADLAVRSSAALGLDARVAADVRRAALLHDIGKLVLPISLLERPERISDAERQAILAHAPAGAQVLQRSRLLGPLAPLIAAHHEPLDGTGSFPPMVDDDRELGARVIALCDRLEAMTAPRPWRAALPAEHAWQELRQVTAEPLAGVVLRVMEQTFPEL